MRTRLRRRDLLLLLGAAVAGGIARRAAASAVGGEVGATLGAFLDTLLPADEFSPSASGLDVPARLLAEAERDPLYARLIRVGCEWIALQTDGSFAAAPEAARNLVVAWMSQAPGDSVPRRFFELVRDHALTLYYASPAGWGGTGFQHPPQPLGYPEIGR